METANGGGEVVKATTEVAVPLETLAKQINAEHRAATTTINTAFNHALRAGELLRQAKQAVKHGHWLQWLKENFEGSERTAQVYIRLAYRREDIEEERRLRAKTQSSADLSVDGALKFLRQTTRKGVTPTEELIKRRRQAEYREQRRLYVLAEFAVRSGHYDAPPGVDDLTWGRTLNEWRAKRQEKVPFVLDALAHEFGILTRTLEPERVGEYLAEGVRGEGMVAHFEREFR